jgi:tetratricopeptide (TPR) repeat protein
VQAPSGQPISGQIAGNVSQNPFAPNANSSTVNASAAPGANNFSTGAQERTNLPMPPPPAEMSPQYAKLKALYDKYQQSHPKTDEEANREFQAALQARRAYEQSLVKAPAASSTTQNPTNGNTTTAQPTLGAQPAPAPEVTNNTPPLQVGPIGADIRASGLRELVQQGEDLARKQRFKDAIGKFMDARQVAPNDMEINIDLANAQLGASFFAESEQSLRDAFTSDPALLMGRYDLTSVIGDQRLQKLIGDLKQLAADGDSATPVFLLAYVSYNQGDTDKAVEYLHLAQTRAGGRDDLIRSLGEHWTLPATQPAK